MRVSSKVVFFGVLFLVCAVSAGGGGDDDDDERSDYNRRRCNEDCVAYCKGLQLPTNFNGWNVATRSFGTVTTYLRDGSGTIQQSGSSTAAIFTDPVADYFLVWMNAFGLQRTSPSGTDTVVPTGIAAAPFVCGHNSTNTAAVEKAGHRIATLLNFTSEDKAIVVSLNRRLPANERCNCSRRYTNIIFDAGSVHGSRISSTWRVDEYGRIIGWLATQKYIPRNPATNTCLPDMDFTVTIDIDVPNVQPGAPTSVDLNSVAISSQLASCGAYALPTAQLLCFA